MLRRFVILVLLFLVIAVPVFSQPVDVRGQLLLPGGGMPSEPIRFALTSGDGRVNFLDYTDSNGRFVLKGLSPLVDYTVEVIGEDLLFSTTRSNFNPSYTRSLRVTLNPPVPQATKPGMISAASGYKPNAEAVDLYEAAQKDIEKEDMDAAEVKLRKAVAKDSKFAQAHVDLGAILLHDRKNAEAETILRQAIVADPKSHVALLALGVALNRQKKFDDSIPVLREALRLQSGLIAAHLHLGIALVETVQLADAERELLIAARKPGDEEAMGLLYLGKLYALNGQFPKGVDALEKYLQKAPSAGNAGEVRNLIGRMKSEMAKAR